jgi:hypothetical protein
MKKRGASKICILAAVSFWLIACWSLAVFAAESPGEKAVNKELEKDVGMPVLAGDLWQKMTHDDKIAFVWGFWTVITMEHYLMDKYPSLRTENFSAKVIEASHKARKTANEIVTLIDAYYRANPDEVRKPVVAVVWDEMTKPNITTGIAGRPLKP